MGDNVILTYSIFKTAFGLCGIAGTERGIIRLILPGMTEDEIVSAFRLLPSAIGRGRFREIEESIRRYFDGERGDFDFPTDLSHCTAFQQRVYKITRTIPYGEFRTYKGIAKKIGLPGAARAVGNALSRNPIPLIIPCHRVIRENGEMGGFTAPGGIDLKIRMIKMETGILTCPIYKCNYKILRFLFMPFVFFIIATTFSISS